MIRNKDGIKICSRCIYDERVPYITFDENGVCNYCHQLDKLKSDYKTGTKEGEEEFERIVEQIKKDGIGKKYDCVIGVSGGTDSSYMLYLAKKMGLRPLAVHYDNTWNSAIASQNIRKVLTSLDIDLYTYVVDNKEVDDIFRSFFLSDAPELDCSTDLALAEVMYRVAWKYNIKYVLEGHSFIEEGITPVGRNYFDGRYIKSIHKMFGRMHMKTYPLMTLVRFLFWTAVVRIKKIRPFWYIGYNKEDAMKFLKKEYDWRYYGGHHLENRMTSFVHSIYFPYKFNTDMRNNTLSAKVRNGKMSRDDALAEYNSEPYVEKDLVEYFKKRLDLTDKQYEEVMNRKPKIWYDYPTYKKTFERLRPLFKILANANLVPMSFYLKYCFPMPKDREW
nr:N-acetyl sugar amidotransferase [uncultured Campylobacter sp.]